MAPRSAGAAWLKQQLPQGRRGAAGVMACALGTLPLAVLQAAVIADLLGAALRGQRPAAPVLALSAFALAAIGRAGLGLVADHAATGAGAAGRTRLRHDVVARLIAAGPSGLRGRHSGELVALVIDRIDGLEGLFARWIPASVLAIAAPLAIALAVLIADPVSGLVLLGAGLLVPIAMALSGIGAAVAARRQFTAMAHLQTRFLDRVRGIATIVLAGRTEQEARALGAAAADLRRHTMRVLRVAFLSSTALDLAMAGCLVLLAVRAAHGLATGTVVDPAPRLFALLLVPEFFAPLRAYAAAYQDQFAARATGEALAALPTAPEPPAGLLAVPPPRTIEAHGVTVAFDDVSLTWDPARGPALDHVSFRATAGETLIVAGPSGAGKSTLIELLLGFATADSGTITLNSMPIHTIVPASLSRMTAWIGQRPLLIAGTLRDNIRFARPDATELEIEEAAARARLAPVVAVLPQGLDTVIGEAGYGLSGGQAQRVAIARAFLRDAPLLLLDEPTAHLDPATEAEVLDSLKRLAIGRTVILVTHSVAAQALPGRRIDLRQGRLLGSVRAGPIGAGSVGAA